MKQWIFMAETPLQIYNSALIALKLSEDNIQATLIVYDQHCQASNLAKLYSELKIFGEIVLVRSVPFKNYKRNILWEFESFLGKKRLDGCGVLDKAYDCYALAYPTPAAFEVLQRTRQANPNIEVVFYEDGTGSYNGNVFNSLASFDMPLLRGDTSTPPLDMIRKVVDKLKIRKLLYAPSALYLKRPELLNGEIAIPTHPIEPNKRLIEELASRLQDTTFSVEKGSIIILDSTRFEADLPETLAIDAIMECIVGLGAAAYLRNHPLSKTGSKLAPCFQDLSGGFWELFCTREKSLDSALLVSVASTAQLSPLLESKHRPYMMFLYKVAFSKEDPLFDKYEQIARIAASFYGDDCDRLFIPESVEEAKAQIQRFLEKRN